jgi:hypothetical protein
LTGRLRRPNKYVSTFRRIGFILPSNGPISAGLSPDSACITGIPELRTTSDVGATMTGNNNMFGIVIGAIVVAVAALFILSGGEFGGKKTVDGDQDLPPVTTEGR